MPEDGSEFPFVSIVVPTFNRSRMLRGTIESFVAQTYAGRLEIIIVDNNSTDDTRDVIAELATESDLIRPIHERRQGAHFARNTGAKAARGDILYFTDDDMIADSNLLSRIVVPFGLDLNVGSATGRVIPRWATEPPGWVLEHCRNELLSLNDRGVATIISDEDPGVFSCHQAVTREAFTRAGGFNPDTNAGEFVGDNETGLNIKIKKLGYKFAYVGESLIEHVIPEPRMRQRYLNSRLADQGFCDSYTHYREKRPGKVKLASSVLRSALMIAPTAALAAVRKARRDSAWHVNLARVFYFRNRMVYDARLMRSEQWRTFALRDNWLVDD